MVRLPSLLMLGLLLAGSLAWPALSEASPGCLRSATGDLLSSRAPGWDRENLIEYAMEQNLPLLIRRTGDVDTPMILVNDVTYPKLKRFLDESIGKQTQLQLGHPNDHGQLRLGHHIIDVDEAGKRGFGEINDTGLSWRHLSGYLPRRTERHDPIVEIAFALDAREMADAIYYQKVRQGAILRVPFIFTDGDIPRGLPNMVKRGEDCFMFCRGRNLDAHIEEIQGHLRAAGFRAPVALLEDPKVAQFLERARARLAKADPLDEARLNPNLMRRDLRLLDGILPESLSPDERIRVANWIIGLDASRRYRRLLGRVGLTNDWGLADARRRRATAILVYDHPSFEEAFRAGEYAEDGVFLKWPKRGLWTP